MGAYLSEPVTDVESESGGNGRLKYGATSMQGWRVDQEDAHNCIVDFDSTADNKECSFFAVYDGHGGAEVAAYTAGQFPEFVKELQEWKKGKYETALVDAFLKFDDTLRSEEVVDKLRVLAGKTKDEAEDENEEDRQALFEEATMPLEEILKRYGIRLQKSGSGASKIGMSKKFLSPNVRQKDKKIRNVPITVQENGNEPLCDGGKEDDENAPAEVKGKLDLDQSADDVEEGAPPSLKTEEFRCKKRSLEAVSSEPDSLPSDECQPKRTKSSETAEEEQKVNGDGEHISDEAVKSFRRHCYSESQTTAKIKEEAAETRERLTNNSGGCDVDATTEEQSTPANATRASPVKSSPGSPGRKRSSKSESEAHDMKEEEERAESAGRAELAAITDHVSAGSAHAQRVTETPETQTAASSDGDNDSDDDEEDDDDYEDGGINTTEQTDEATTTDSDDDDDDDDDEEEEDEEEEEGEEGDSSVDGEETAEDAVLMEEQDEEEEMFAVPSGETPGQDSGTTACVAVLVGSTVFVANVGDSRCVLSRGGIALDLSQLQDHKPEDVEEKRRIERAGGRISMDGRVNGGLNLSRALGDHFYKRNEQLPLKDQMISSLPDIVRQQLVPQDRFMVLACDGIWNSMSSQEVVDFVSERIDKLPLETICEEMCKHCLSPSTAGDGTGCDNMTVIILKFAGILKELDRSVTAADGDTVAIGNGCH